MLVEVLCGDILTNKAKSTNKNSFTGKITGKSSANLVLPDGSELTTTVNSEVKIASSVNKVSQKVILVNKSSNNPIISIGSSNDLLAVAADHIQVNPTFLSTSGIIDDFCSICSSLIDDCTCDNTSGTVKIIIGASSNKSGAHIYLPIIGGSYIGSIDGIIALPSTSIPEDIAYPLPENEEFETSAQPSEYFQYKEDPYLQDFTLPPKYFIIRGSNGPYLYKESGGGLTTFPTKFDPEGQHHQFNEPINGMYKYSESWASGTERFYLYTKGNWGLIVKDAPGDCEFNLKFHGINIGYGYYETEERQLFIADLGPYDGMWDDMYSPLPQGGYWCNASNLSMAEPDENGVYDYSSIKADKNVEVIEGPRFTPAQEDIDKLLKWCKKIPAEFWKSMTRYCK